MTDDWKQAARRELLGLRDGSGAWGYRAGAPANVETTALAALGLLASPCESDPEDGDDLAVAETSARWLAAIQRPDGSLGLTQELPTPGWASPFVLLLWAALPGFEVSRSRTARWLLEQAGEVEVLQADLAWIVGHDTSLLGWPWVEGTDSWIEPTAMAVLSLGRSGLGDHPRVREGLRLIRDRAIIGGGWNYGNKAVFGRELRPQPAPTGLAMLALARHDRRSPLIDQAVGYLLAALPETRAASSIGWGVLALRAWHQRPEASVKWLAETYHKVTGRPDAAPRLALLLLAGGGRALELLLPGSRGDRDD